MRHSWRLQQKIIILYLFSNQLRRFTDVVFTGPAVANGQLLPPCRPDFAKLNCCAGANRRVSPSSGEFTWKVFRRVPPWERVSFTATYTVPRSAI
jgi:hypothetical protein